MNERTLRALVEAGAVKRIRIVADGARFHVEADTPTATVVVVTTRGDIKTGSSLDSAARWVRSLGIGSARIELSKWQPDQTALRF